MQTRPEECSIKKRNVAIWRATAKNDHHHFCKTFQQSKLKVSSLIEVLWKALLNENYNTKQFFDNLNYENTFFVKLEMDLDSF